MGQKFYRDSKNRVRPITPKKTFTGTKQVGTAHLKVKGVKIHTNSVPQITKDQLFIYAKNDRELNGILDKWAKNFAGKMSRGTYKQDKALEALRKHFVPEMLQKYKSDYNTKYVSHYYIGRTSKSDKSEMARYFLPDVEGRAIYYAQNGVD